MNGKLILALAPLQPASSAELMRMEGREGGGRRPGLGGVHSTCAQELATLVTLRGVTQPILCQRRREGVRPHDSTDGGTGTRREEGAREGTGEGASPRVGREEVRAAARRVCSSSWAN